MDPLLALAIFALGLAFGSFLNVCIYRMPRGLSVVYPGSACPGCKQPIAMYDNVPVLSWLLLGGRCRKCQTPISPRYMVVEFLCALLFLACYGHFGLTLAALKYCTLGFLLLGLIFTDAETQLLPDKLTLTGVALGLVFSFIVPVNDLVAQMLPSVFPLPAGTSSWRTLSLLDSLAGATIGASFIYGVGAIYLRARGRPGMGFGDVKLMAMVGAFLGTRLTMFTIFTGSIAGSLFGLWTLSAVWIKRTRRRMRRPAIRRDAWTSAVIASQRFPMPFGVFLGGMAMVALFFGNQFLHWYWGLL